jgi:hypothetical protein
MTQNPFKALEMDIKDYLERFSTPNIPINHSQNRPVTPISQVLAPLVTPGKKKTKRKADSPMPAISPITRGKPSLIHQKGKSATAYLGLAQKILFTAIETEKRKKEEQYTEDNDIQLLINELGKILAKRPKELQQESLESLNSLEL